MLTTGKSYANDCPASVEECRAQLDRIVKSPEFDATARERRFLQYVVDETLDGRAARIKAYSIATEVFERDDAFDPQNDPIVRIEAGRLRRALERYYLTAGTADTLVVTIPKGGYVPVFTLRDPPVPPPTVAAEANDPQPVSLPRWQTASRRRMIAVTSIIATLVLLIGGLVVARQPDFLAREARLITLELPHLYVRPIEAAAASETSREIATGVSKEIIGQLARFRDITVVVSDVEPPGPVRYELQGSVSLMPDTFRLGVRLVERSDGTVLWADSFQGSHDPSQLVPVQVAMADTIAATLAQVDGVIMLAENRSQDGLSRMRAAAYTCIQSFYAFRAALNLTAIPEVRRCLEETVQQFPDYSDAWALLALLDMDDLRSRFPYDQAVADQIIARVLDRARRAVALDPRNARALQAEMLALYFDGQFDAGSEVAARAIALNPNDTELMTEYGNRRALAGEWQAGCAIMRAAIDRKPMPRAYNRTSLALCAYFEGNMTEALTRAGSVTAKSHPLALLIALVIYGEAGETENARRIADLLRQSAPGLFTDVRTEVAARIARAEDVDRIMQSLRGTGLPELSGLNTL